MRIGLLGKSMDRIPGIAFRVMNLMFNIRDRFASVWSLLDEFGIKRGQTVVDYGCGPGSYLRHASELVGPEGLVFAIDIHELAIKAVTKRISKEQLGNVTPIITNGKRTPLADGTADVIYALDMFHMVSDPHVFLRELNRVCKRDGLLFIDKGHQSGQEAMSKIKASGMWEIVEERKRYMKCRPVLHRVHPE